VDVPATRVRSGLKNIAAPPKRTESTQTRPARPVIAAMKARQSAKIRELGQVLIDVGLRSLDDQANALGPPRSTAWTILKTCHKSTGLSAAIIERMLRSSKLPPRARAILVEYVEEKSFDLYGGSRRQQQRFAVRLSNTIASWSGSDETQRRGREEMPWRCSTLPGPMCQGEMENAHGAIPKIV
jgi:hypothetical protein